MRIKLQKKFTEKHIDEFINSIYSSIKKDSSENFEFDLSETEWISNQNLLLFSALLKYLYNCKIDFKVYFKKKGISTIELSERTKIQVVQLWEIWEIYSVIGTQDYSNYFDITNNTIKDFKNELISKKKYSEKSKEIYNRFGITPLITLRKINDYKDSDLLEHEINPIYQLNDVIQEKLFTSGFSHPFVNNTLSAIITKELYENFLDHSIKNSFKSDVDLAFMSLALQLNPANSGQSLLESNFKEEEIPETIGFFKNKEKFKNQSFIQFSFLDFGEGIPTTLRDQYINDNQIISDDLFTTIKDYEILKYAFKHNSSRNPILNVGSESNLFIPRGLFDLLTIVKRYGGLLIARSNYGKIIYDFSENKDFEQAFGIFGDESKFFPGTFITIYLPSLDDSAVFDKSAIKPIFNFKTDKVEKINNINIYTLAKKLSSEKSSIYNDLLRLLSNNLLKSGTDNTLNYISFLGCKDERIIKKTIFFLLTDYNINLNNSIVVLHPPPKKNLSEINEEVLNLNKIIKDFKIHPIPFIYLSDANDDVEIEWIGIYEEDDKLKLNQFLLEDVLLPKTDFKDVDNIFGNLHFSDRYGNIDSKIPKSKVILEYYIRYKKIDDILIEDLVIENKCIRQDGLYLCNGNYYQSQFLQLIDLLNSKSDCNEITKLLFQNIKESTDDDLSDANYIAITSSSHKILNSLIRQNLITEEQCLYFDSYITFEKDLKSNEIKENSNYILVCDAISTGNLTRRIESVINKNNSKLFKIAVIANTLDLDFENTKKFAEEFESRIIHLFKFPIKKFRRKEIENKSAFRDVIRINPYTNIPIIFSEDLTIKETILLSNSTFIDYVENDDIHINFKIFNNLIHPYFFNLKKILFAENNKIADGKNSLLNKIFNELLKNKIEVNDKLKIFYPKDSDIKTLKFEKFISKVLNNQSIEIYELERFNTDEGWKFPHTTDFYSNIVENNNILIFDDGSCTGDSLLQMINELTIFRPKKIDLLCIVGRVNDHKREFFSKINSLKYNLNKGSDLFDAQYGTVDVNIYFASHWHISTFYLNNSPYSGEILWLKELLKIQNTPLSIKHIASRILEEISPKNSIDKDYKYFPKNRETLDVPKKDLILVRNEVGKIIGYRFYKESFKWFNEFIAKYESNIRSIDRTKDIELLCMSLLYEPYLYDKISNILPDIKEKIEEFVDSILFGSPRNKNKKINIQKDLYYDWSQNRKDIIHLFFIVYKDDKLIQKLNPKIFEDLLNFSKDTFKKINPINYLFYKFLRLFPIHVSEISSKNSTNIVMEFFSKIIEENNLDLKSLAEVKRFYSYISTLPSGKDFESQIQKIKDIYWENDQPKLHDERGAYGVNFSITLTNLRELSDLCIRKQSLNKEKIILVREGWWNIKNTLLNPLISFFRSFEDFFKPYPYMIYYNQIDGKETSLISLYSFIDDFIYNLEQKGNDIDNFNKSIQYLGIINDKLGSESEEFRGLFKNSKIKYKSFVEKLLVQLNTLKNSTTVENNLNLEFDINIPEKYIDKIVLKEIIDNLKFYSNAQKEIVIKFTNEKDFVVITIVNHYTDRVKEFSSNEGINCLKQLSESPLFNFQYDYKVNTEVKEFYQKLKFKL
ncbi:hypothetical protein [Flavobacterium sp. 245]|uniref:hypothetical protein n=1 Tax=Flavobacterium sp. 245 TaxID=2512115 RepID=UPI001061AE3C|nr:hypothetical protein [Flavobacterium sp. 245]TDP00331.1 hypothetical protein EV145_106226 [Flavobacterium sp. 245]